MQKAHRQRHAINRINRNGIEQHLPARNRDSIDALSYALLDARANPQGAMRIVGELRAAEWEITAFALILSTWGQIVVIDRWWSFVLSQIPFKEDIMRGPTYAAIGLAIAFFCTMIAGTRSTARGLILAMPACVLFTMFGLAASWGITPVWFAMAITACNMAGLSIGAVAKYWREQ